MAERTLIDRRRSVVLPPDADPMTIAAAMNPRCRRGSPDIALPSAALRAANLRILGSGQGSVSTAAIISELPALAAEIAAGTFTVDAAPWPLAEVEAAWTDPAPAGRRVVLTP